MFPYGCDTASCGNSSTRKIEFVNKLVEKLRAFPNDVFNVCGWQGVARLGSQKPEFM